MGAAQRRALLLDAAVAVFAERGYSGATLADVAARAGVTKPIVYRHFASKDALYVLLLEEHAAELVATVSRAVAGAAGGPAEQVRAGVAAFLAAVERRPFTRRLLFRDPEAGPEVVAAHARVHAEATAALAAALASDEALLRGDPGRGEALEMLAHVLQTSLNGVAAWWFAHPEVPREDVVERAMQLLWPGLRELREEGS